MGILVVDGRIEGEAIPIRRIVGHKEVTAIYTVGRPVFRKVLKRRIWVVPPVCLGSR